VQPRYEGEKYKLWVGDCLVVMPQLPAESVHLVVTSPPYYASKDYGSDEANFENAPTFEDYLALMRRALQEVYRLLCAGGRCCIVIDDKYTSLKTHGTNFCYGTHAHLIVAAQEIGFLYKGLIIWKKMRASHASGGAHCILGSFPYPPNIPIITMFEYILIFQKPGKFPQVSEDVKEKSRISKEDFASLAQSIWEVPPEKRAYGSCPAPFPLEIPRRFIRLFSFVGNVVLDPFAGSGTTLLAAILEGRVGWGIEINEVFAREAAERLNSVLQALI